MALSQAAYKVEQAVGHDDNAVTTQDIAGKAAFDREEYGDPSVKMKALAWMGKGKVEMIECPKPKVIEDRDVILKVTGSTVCGSDLHLLHGRVLDKRKDIWLYSFIRRIRCRT